jgi:DNA processing protein
MVTLGDPEYPAQLLPLEDPPLVLYLQGMALDATTVGAGIAVVGSRNPTPQGESNAHAFAKAMGEAGLAVVSGLALGVDGAAHQGALDAATPDRVATIAVVGTGLDRVYPRRHLALAHAIAQRGLLLSEFPLGTPPLAPNFPKRIRLSAGLTRGTLVVEAALQSGSLITARQAVEQGKDVFAIPGSIHSTQSRGCHYLIKQGAKLVESAADILDEWGFGTTAHPLAPGVNVSSAHGDSLLLTMGFDPVSLDALIARTGDGAAALQARLLELEMDGQVARLAGGLFQRVGAG